jgi:hypothetical protein
MGIGILAHGYYRQGMKTLTMKIPDELLGWLERGPGAWDSRNLPWSGRLCRNTSSAGPNRLSI